MDSYVSGVGIRLFVSRCRRSPLVDVAIGNRRVGKGLISMKLRFVAPVVIATVFWGTSGLTASASTEPTTASAQAAGYVVGVVSPITSFAGSLTVPSSVGCPSTTGSPGPDMISYVVLLGNTAQVSMGWEIDCSSGAPDYVDGFARLSVFNSSSSEATVQIRGGDSLRFDFVENVSGDTATTTVTDKTTGFSSTATGPMSGTLTAINALTWFPSDGPGPVTPIPSFNPIRFAKLTFNGDLITSLDNTRLKMYDGSTLQVTTSQISTSGTFYTTFKHD
jgi:hypothetical protein